MITRKSRQLAAATLALLTSVACASVARAAQDPNETNSATSRHQPSCSDRTIAGDYAWSAEGFLIATPGLPDIAPFRSIGTAHLDGKGNLTWLERTVINGQVVNTDFTEASGAYSINSNCTGSAVIYSPFSPVPLKLALVISGHGEEFRTVLLGNAITTTFKRIE